MKLRKLFTTSSLVLISNVVNAQVGTVYMCKPCPVGTHSNGTTECPKCQKGEYQDKVAQKTCNKCDAGKYQGSEGQASCNNCAAGTWAPVGSASCTNCLTTGVATCNPKTGYPTSCKPGYGFVPIESGSIDGSCGECPAGTYSEGGTMACTACHADEGTNRFMVKEAYGCNWLGFNCSYRWVEKQGDVCGSDTKQIITKYCQDPNNTLNTNNKANPTTYEGSNVQRNCSPGYGCSGNYCHACQNPYYSTGGISDCQYCSVGTSSSTSTAACPKGLGNNCSQTTYTTCSWSATACNCSGSSDKVTGTKTVGDSCLHFIVSDSGLMDAGSYTTPGACN